MVTTRPYFGCYRLFKGWWCSVYCISRRMISTLFWVMGPGWDAIMNTAVSWLYCCMIYAYWSRKSKDVVTTSPAFGWYRFGLVEDLWYIVVFFLNDDTNFVPGDGSWLCCYSHWGHALAGMTTSQKLLVFNEMMMIRADFGCYKLLKADDDPFIA
jgi:hypothetical protein